MASLDEDSATTTDWPVVHRRVVEAFAAGWRRPHPHAWDDVVDPHVELVQPLLRPCVGREGWHEEVRRLLTFAPDLTGEVLDWAGRDDVLFIDLRLRTTVGGAPLVFQTIDRLRLTPAGRIARRDAFFDSWPVARALLGRPAAWWPWWRSGIGPFLARRAVLAG